MQTHIDQESLVHANAQFWEQMLGMQMETVPATETFCVDPGHVHVGVNLSGEWRGRIEVRLASDLARAVTAAMLMQPAETVAEADTLDATREVVNMIAGILKSNLPHPTHMTVPDAAISTEQLCSALPLENTLIVAFRHQMGGMLVRVHEQNGAQ